MLEISDILSLVELTVILFYIVGIVLTVNNKMRPYSTGWFVGVPFLYSGSFLAMILMAKYPLFVMISIVIAIIFAVGMIAVFCGVTNSPVTSLFIAFEIFGMEALPYFLLGVAISYMLSGYHSLYHAQRIVSVKFKEHEEKEMVEL